VEVNVFFCYTYDLRTTLAMCGAGGCLTAKKGAWCGAGGCLTAKKGAWCGAVLVRCGAVFVDLFHFLLLFVTFLLFVTYFLLLKHG
jgi:hypothetical protein